MGEDEPDELGGPGGGMVIVDAMPLNWDSALLGHYGQALGSVPPGTSRPVYFAYICWRRNIIARHWQAPNPPSQEEDDRLVGAFAVFPARTDRIQRFDIDASYTVRLDVTVNNAETFTRWGRFVVRRNVEEEQFLEDDSTVLLEMRWIEALHDPRPLRRPWFRH